MFDRCHFLRSRKYMNQTEVHKIIWNQTYQTRFFSPARITSNEIFTPNQCRKDDFVLGWHFAGIYGSCNPANPIPGHVATRVTKTRKSSKKQAYNNRPRSIRPCEPLEHQGQPYGTKFWVKGLRSFGWVIRDHSDHWVHATSRKGRG